MTKKGIYIFFSGDFPEGNTKNARLKAIALGLQKWGYHPRLASVFPSRYSAQQYNFKKSSEWQGMRFTYLSGDTHYYKNKVMRAIQILFGQFMAFIYATINLRKMDYAYFYCPKLLDTLPLLLYLKLCGKKIIVDQTELFSSLSKGQKLHRWEEKMIAKNANVLLLISKKLIKHFSELYPKANIYHFPIMVDLKRFEHNYSSEVPKMIGYLGSFAAKDGVLDILHAVHHLRNEYPKLKLKLMGFNANKELIDRVVDELQLEDHVIHAGKLMYENIPKELDECDTLILNRTSDNFSTYGFPVKLGEYFAANKTVLMSNCGGYSDDFENANQVYKYEPDDVFALAETLRFRYKNPNEAEAVAIRGREYAENYFDSETNSLLLKNILAELK